MSPPQGQLVCDSEFCHFALQQMWFGFSDTESLSCDGTSKMSVVSALVPWIQIHSPKTMKMGHMVEGRGDETDCSEKFRTIWFLEENSK